VVNINLSGINSTTGQFSSLNTGDTPTTSTGVSLTALGRTVYLDQVNGNDTTGVAGSSLYKFATIQAALTASTSGDVILASPGTYTGDFYGDL
jgi:hypothetical protein